MPPQCVACMETTQWLPGKSGKHDEQHVVLLCGGSVYFFLQASPSSQSCAVRILAHRSGSRLKFRMEVEARSLEIQELVGSFLRPCRSDALDHKDDHRSESDSVGPTLEWLCHAVPSC